MTPNCWFSENDVGIRVKLLSFLQKDDKGYLIEAKVIRHEDVIRCLTNYIIPEYIKDDNYFKIRIAVNNNTGFYLNNIKVESLEDDRLYKIPLSKIKIEKLIIHSYSSKTNHKGRQCYAQIAWFVI